ncbi:Homeodomain-like superfamily protein [Striga hermonthica]|uniref:Homeodomain-like superfamily protein n=1 Tax=Striga hermonthica TaxID=68872 RepID=A0A9N7NPN1_STRHE|nr:Homeodomain-like superfamily protein [Striga hermonthica]
MSLVLSSDAKPRLKWTQELHQRFVDAVIHLGGPEKATPKSLMRVMGISGLTLYHLKSHLQANIYIYINILFLLDEINICFFLVSLCWNKKKSLNYAFFFRSLQVAQALQMQMDVQKKLHEQIEVQKHLQLRIEAQGKYLHSVLKKAHDTLSEYGGVRSIEVEQVKAQLSQLVSMVDSGCSNSSISVLTESDSSMLQNRRENKLSIGHHYGYSVETSLTSSDSSERNVNHSEKDHKLKQNRVVLPLMEMHPAKQETKRRKKCDELKGFDLNCKSMNESNSGAKGLDLNCNGVEMVCAPFSV